MKFTCLKDDFLQGISMAQKAVTVRSTMPILSGILIEVGDRIKLTGYDMEIGIEYTFDADISEPGSLVINSRLLGDIIRRLPEDTVKVESGTGETVVIESGASKFSIKGLDAKAYPSIPEITDYSKIELVQQDFKKMVAQTIFAVSNDESRPVLNGSFIKFENNLLEIVSIDGFRLAMQKRLIEEEIEPISFIVLGKSLNEIGRMSENSKEKITIYKSSNHILFDTGKVKVISRLIAGEYMNYNGIIPKSSQTTITAHKSALLDAVERASIIITTDERKFPVTFKSMDDDTLVITSNTDIGSVREEIAVSIKGEAVDIDFNPKYFIEALKVIDDDEVTMSFNGNMGPCVINPVEGDEYTYLVLPLRR